MTKQVDECRWCKTPLEPHTGPGRPRAFCSQACRQWDWVTRRATAKDSTAKDEVIVVRREAIEHLRGLAESLCEALTAGQSARQSQRDETIEFMSAAILKALKAFTHQDVRGLERGTPEAS